MSNAEGIATFTDINNRYVAYQTSYNDDLFNIVDQHKNKTIAENLVFEQAKNIVDELKSATEALQELKERAKGLDTFDTWDEAGKQVLTNKEQVVRLEDVIETIEDMQE